MEPVVNTISKEMKKYLLDNFVVGDRVRPSKYLKIKKEYPALYEILGGNPDTIYKNIKLLAGLPRGVQGRKSKKEFRSGKFVVRKRPLGFNLQKEETLDDFMKSIGGYEKEDSLYIYKDKKIAVEYCDLFEWSELHKTRNSLLDKSKEFEKRGIRSLHVFADEWYFKRDVVKSIIKTSIGIYEQKIPARKCKVKYLTKQEEKDFFNRNHLQGFSSSRYCVGLIFNNEIVSAISLAAPRFSRETDYELIRYANKMNTQILGGFSKLLKRFREDHPGSIMSYSDRRMFSGGLYRQLFTELEPSGQGYFYTDGNVRENRIKFQKYKLASTFPQWANDSEWVIAHRLGWYRIWDCGNWRFKIE